jgi:Pyruvate/2-oxoacid:ferredoxin oxidoreductase gamma subunit
MEREILLTGIGGQGVQLAANVLAHAALAEGRDVQLFGSYGGMMRGGNTDAELVIADDRIEAPPTVGAAWAAVALHPDYAAPVLSRVVADGLVLRDDELWDAELERSDLHVVDVPAAELATGVGNVMAASMVMLGALATLTGLTRLDSLRDGARACVPPYRQQHLELNDRALQAGAGAVRPLTAGAAWPSTTMAGSVGT